MSAFDLETQRLLLESVSMIVGFSANWIIQSTLLISAGLIIGRLMRNHGSAAQSLVFRTTLAAVLVCPLATWSMSAAGFSGYSVDLPRDWVYQTQSVIAELPTSSAAAASDDRFPTETLSASSPLLPVEMDFDSSNGRETATPFAIAPQKSIFADVPVAENEDAQAPSFPVDVKAAASAISLQYFGVLAIAAVAVWLIVALVLVVRLATAWRAMSRLRRRATEARPEIVKQCQNLAEQMNVLSPAVCCSPFLPSACLTGIRTPIILLPAQEHQPVGEAEVKLPLPMRDVLIHELAHLRRHDCHWNLARQIANAVSFFQPLLWLLSRKLESTAEEVCDDYVVQFGGDRFDYADRLTDIAELYTAPVSAAGVGIVSLRSMLARRVARILDTSRSLSTRVGNFLLVIILAGGLIGTTAVALLGIGPQVPQADAETLVGLRDELANEAADQTEPLEPLHFAGQVVDPDGNPAAGAKVFWKAPDVFGYSIGLQLPNVRPIATTNAKGEFNFTSRIDPVNRSLGSIAVVKEGFGFGWKPAYELEISGEWLEETMERHGLLTGITPAHRAKLRQKISAGRNQPLKLVKDDEPILGTISDAQGKPVVGVNVQLYTVFANDLTRWKQAASQPDADQNSYPLSEAIGGSLAMSLVKPATTDHLGRFRLQGIGPNRLVALLVSGQSIETKKLYVRTEQGTEMKIPDNMSRGNHEVITWHPAKFSFEVAFGGVVTGTVRDAETKKPLAGVTVKNQPLAQFIISARRSKFRSDFIRTVTDDQGNFRLGGMPIGLETQIAAYVPKDTISYAKNSFNVEPLEPQMPLTIDMDLQRSVWVEGQFIDKQTGRGIVGQIEYYIPNENPNSDLERSSVNPLLDHSTPTDSHGRFKVEAYKGIGYLAFRSNDTYPKCKAVLKSDGTLGPVYDEGYETAPYKLEPSSYNLVAEINPAPQQTNLELELPLDGGIRLTGQVVDSGGNPVEKFRCTHPEVVKGAEGTFEIVGYEPSSTINASFYDEEGTLARQLLIQGKQTEDLQVRLLPTASISGRLVDDEGDPIPNARIHSFQNRTPALPFDTPNFSRTPYRTDETGRFEVSGLVPNVRYTLSAKKVALSPSVERKMDVEINLEPGEVKLLGDVRMVVDPSEQKDASVINPQVAEEG